MDINIGNVFLSGILGIIIVIVLLLVRFSSSSTASEKKYIYRGKLTVEEVSKHTSFSDAWIIIDGKVYDVTDYIDLHPGGDAILRNVGKDSSIGFHGPQHPASAGDIITKYLIGEI